MENNHDTERANTDPRQLESTQNAEPASVPAIPMAKVFNRLGIRSTLRPDARQDDLVNALSSSEGPMRAAALQALGKRAEQGEQLPIAAVVAALHDPEWSVRAIAALTLRLGGARHLRGQCRLEWRDLCQRTYYQTFFFWRAASRVEMSSPVGLRPSGRV